MIGILTEFGRGYWIEEVIRDNIGKWRGGSIFLALVSTIRFILAFASTSSLPMSVHRLPWGFRAAQSSRFAFSFLPIRRRRRTGGRRDFRHRGADILAG